MLSVRCLSVCLSVLSVCDVGVLWRNGWMDQDENWQGSRPGHIVLDGDPASPSQRAKPPIFGQCLLWPNGWMDQDAPWFGDRPRARPAPSSKRGQRPNLDLRYSASEPGRELVREMVCDLLATCQRAACELDSVIEFGLSRTIQLARSTC